MRAGVFQCEGGGLLPQQRIEKLALALAAKPLDLVVCPELFLSGYNVGGELPAFAESQGGPLMTKLAQVARASGTAIVYGYPERLGDQLFNAAACLSADGLLLANHRKLMLPPGFESQYFDPGQGTTLFQLGGLCCGLLVCYDAEFPEAVRALAQAGAQVVIVPTALVKNWSVVSRRVMPTRAFENGVWLIYANHAGQEGDAHYLGESCIAAPDGQDAARAGSAEELISAELTLAAVAAAQKRLPYLAGLADLRDRLA